MGWMAHKIVLRLRSPMHIGAGKVGNLQRTRPYVAGRNLWGALTARLTRDSDSQGKPAPEEYEAMGGRIHDELAFTYFYPTINQDGDVKLWPWGDGFRFRHLNTYASTALDYTVYSAQEASLHEVECLTPHTRKGEPVYLTGYIFQAEGSSLKWRDALTRLQIGGERGYGWGRVEPVVPHRPAADVFGYGLRLDGKRPVITAPQGRHLLAHALAAGLDEYIAGPVEPLVGRETRPDSRFGVRLSRALICYAPGARVAESVQVQIGRFGVWERCTEPGKGVT